MNWISLIWKCIHISLVQGGKHNIRLREKRKVSYLTDHSLSNLASSLWVMHIQHTMHLAHPTPAGCHHSIWLRDRKLDSFIGVLYVLSLSTPDADEGMIYLKRLIMAGTAKRLDENPILPHNRQRQVWVWPTLTHCDVYTTARWLNVKQWLLCGEMWKAEAKTWGLKTNPDKNCKK